MRSARSFASEYSSAWALIAPTADIFTRRLNLSLCVREFTPLVSKVAPQRRGLINEIAFRLFAERLSGHRAPDDLDKAVKQATKLLEQLDRGNEEISSHLSDDEMSDIETQVVRISRYLKSIMSVSTDYAEDHILDEIEVSPFFKGCGFVDGCHGDIVIGRLLLEIKAGDRAFRTIDVRQVLTYATLCHMSGERTIESVALCNPRTGMTFECSLESICYEVAGRPANEVLYLLGQVMSGGDISR